MCESPRAYCADGYARSGSACAPVVAGACGTLDGTTQTDLMEANGTQTITEGFESGIPAGWTQEGDYS